MIDTQVGAQVARTARAHGHGQLARPALGPKHARVERFASRSVGSGDVLAVVTWPSIIPMMRDASCSASLIEARRALACSTARCSRSIRPSAWLILVANSWTELVIFTRAGFSLSNVSDCERSVYSSSNSWLVSARVASTPNSWMRSNHSSRLMEPSAFGSNARNQSIARIFFC